MSSDRTPSFGNVLKERRLAARLTQEALAEHAGISARTIADIERGVIRAPRQDTLEMLAGALALPDEERQEWRQLRRDLSMRTSAGSAPPSLPAPPNDLIGRDREVNALVNLLTHPATRLVTVTGPGGVGKTRIALAVAHTLADRFPDGVRFIEFAPVRDPELFFPTIAHRLGIRDGNPDSIQGRLTQFLSRRDMLLILDNVEHLRSAAAGLATLLSNAPTLHVLATSRAGLRIAADHEFPVLPLRLPDWDNSRVSAELEAYPAIQLFLQRAQQIRPDFSLTDQNAAAVSSICACLDGLPLAIELAAARVKVLPPEQIVPKLVHRLAFLTGGLADAPDRHRTMSATIGWSYDLLEESDQRFFRRLATFVGGWTLGAAEALAPSTTDPLESLSSLVNDNLIYQLPEPDGGVRFSMLETVREFGLEQLEALGEYDQARREHADYFLRFVEREEQELRGPNQIEALSRLSVELANIRGALEWSQHPDADPDIGLRLVSAMTWFWESRGHVSEGREWLTRALDRDAGTPEMRMRALAGSGWMAHIQHDSPTAYRQLEESLNLTRELGDQWWESWVLHLMGRVAYFDSDAGSAFQFGEQSLRIARRLDDAWIIAWDYHLFGLAAFIEGDLEAARAHYERSLAIREEIGYPEGVSLINGLLGVLTLQEGRRVDALRQLKTALEIGREIGARWLVINWIANIVLIAAEAGESDRAARLAGFVESMSGITGAIPIPISDITLQKGIHIARESLDRDRYRDHYDNGQRMTMDAAVADALALTVG